MKILVTGDREWTRTLPILTALFNILEEYNLQPDDVTVVHGDCRGADKLAAEVAKYMGMKPVPYPADWTRYGLGAGPIRNQQMIDENPDTTLALVFHPDLANSKGTKDMVKRLEQIKIPYRHIK